MIAGTVNDGGLTKACSGRAISLALMQGLSLAAVRARR
jgi:hypothetical protein